MKKLPLPARTLIALVVAGGTGCVVANLPDLGRWSRADALAFVLLAVGVAIGEQFQLPVRFGSERLNLSLTEAVWVGALVLARASVVTMAVALGVFLGHALRRRAPFKVAFNVGQFVLALTAAELIVGVHEIRPLRLRRSSDSDSSRSRASARAAWLRTVLVEQRRAIAIRRSSKSA